MNVILGPLFDLLYVILDLYIWVLIIGVVMSWLISFNIVNTTNRFVYMVADFLYKITEPALRPIRRLLPSLGGLDLSPLVLLLGVWFIQRILLQLRFSISV